MTSHRRYSPVEWGALVAATLASALGGTMMVAWLAELVDLLRLANPGPTLRFNTAVAFLFIGAALFCSVTRRRRSAAWLAGAVFAFCGLHFIEIATGAKLGMEMSLLEPSLELIKRVGNGRMPLSSALCFTLLSAAILARGSARFGLAAASLLGIAVCILSLVAICRYAMGTDLRIGWQVTASMALTTAVGLFLLGGAIVALAYREAAAADASWLAYPIAFALAASSVMVWRELVDSETVQLRRSTASAAAAIRLQVFERLQTRLLAVERLGLRWRALDSAQRRRDVQRLFEDFHGILAINWMTPELRFDWSCAAVYRKNIIGERLPPGPRHVAVERARNTQRIAFTPVLQLLDGNIGFVGFLPTFDEGKVTGYLTTAFRLETILGDVADDHRFDGYTFSVDEGGQTVFSSVPVEQDAVRPAVVESSRLALRDLKWRFNVWPTPETVALHHSKAPNLALAQGLLSSLVLGVAINLRQRAARQTAEARRSAAAWRDSEQRFDLAVGASQDGIWEWRIESGGYYGSPRFREILGYPLGGLLSVDDWFERIHSADLPQVKQSIEDHLRIRTPYDVVARVRTVQNQWIWLHVRGQAAWGADGQPYRMAGAISDITAERLAKKQLLAHVDAIAGSNRALAEMAEAAQAAAHAKATFLRNMSHELRTPLNSIIGFSTGLLRSKDHSLDDYQRDRVERIAASGRHLLELVNNVLDLAKAEAREQALLMEAIDVAELFDELIAMIEPLLQKRPSVKFNAVVPEDLGTPLLDRTKLKQVLLNLLANAVKFTDAGMITLEARGDGENWIFAVSDTGIGIPPHDQHRIFENFEQVHSTGRSVEGTGLGLAICATFASAMQGEIALRSQPGMGSTFSLVVPRTVVIEEEIAEPATAADAQR